MIKSCIRLSKVYVIRAINSAVVPCLLLSGSRKVILCQRDCKGYVKVLYETVSVVLLLSDRAGNKFTVCWGTLANRSF